jgi:hypothetical protein
LIYILQSNDAQLEHRACSVANVDERDTEFEAQRDSSSCVDTQIDTYRNKEKWSKEENLDFSECIRGDKR